MRKALSFLFSNLELLTVARDARDDALFVRVRGDVAVDDLILFPHVHREDVLHRHILQQILDAEALAAFTKARVKRRHRRRNLGRDALSVASLRTAEASFSMAAW